MTCRFSKPERLEEPATRWLLDSDPSIRWQVLRDLTGASADKVAAERARVATKGVGARLLARGMRVYRGLRMTGFPG
jgi:hypothetical protein